jgi:hypothetical protein
VRPFDNFEAKFHKNSTNIIHGSCGSGKSTIIRAILFAFCVKHRYFTSRVYNDGIITLRLFPNQDSISITGMGNQNSARGYRCLIADGSLERLPKNMIVPFFAELKNLGIQVIITASLLIDVSQLSNDAHIIPL